MSKPTGPKTEMINWRGGQMEFCRLSPELGNPTLLAKPPWYVVRYRGLYWDKDKWNYDWIDYGGPPRVFLTRAAAEKRASAFRRQYGTKGEGPPYNGRGYPPLKVEVVKLTPEVSC